MDDCVFSLMMIVASSAATASASSSDAKGGGTQRLGTYTVGLLRILTSGQGPVNLKPLPLHLHSHPRSLQQGASVNLRRDVYLSPYLESDSVRI